jgi:acyl-CoA reductase-like NAD-dependent aldehyde dehydrogenase
VHTAADHFEYFAGWADKLEGAVIPVWPGEALDYTLREPYGVVGLIIPFNGPLVSMGLRVAPALATGNTIVLKPSEFAPYGPLRFAQMCAAAGVPPGVFNVLPGDGSSGQALVEHPGVDKIHFTGSVPTARDVLTRAAHTIKPVALELGGKSANIVFADADLDQAAGMAVIASVVAMSGQTCICPSRLLVEASIYDDFVDRVVAQAEAVAIGDPFASGTLMGPVISEAACQRILGVIEQGQTDQAGALLTGGSRAGGELANGYFVQPTVFGEVDNQSSLARNEIFGPVLAAMRFEDEAHAVSLANDTDYGLAGYVHTADITRGHRMAAALDAGYLSINGWAMMPPGAPFGGNGRSGIGRLGGRSALDEFLRTKNVFVGL